MSHIAAPQPERGVALILGMLFTTIAVGMVLSGSLYMGAHRSKTETNFRLTGQAMQFSRAGLIEGLGWFRKSTTQPVVLFDPQLSPSTTPPLLETLDPEIGIVREFQISGQIWGRYEVWKQWDGDPDPVRLAWRQQFQAEDITAQSSVTGVGVVWRLKSIGYVFRQVDPAQSFNQFPNQVLGSEILGTEIRRMTLAPPGQAAVCSKTGSQTTIDRKVNIQGGNGAGVYYKTGTGSVTVQNSPTIVGVPGLSSSSSYDDSVKAVFGVGAKALETLADDRITHAAVFPSPTARNALYYVEVPTLSFTSALPLLGTACIYVKGDVDFSVGSTSYFTGMLFVDGDLTIREPCDLNGTIICTGTTTVWGESDWININYDDESLNQLRKAIGQYRLSAPFRRVLVSE